MQELDSYDNIREKLLNAEVQAPDFDALFGKETLGVDSLHSSISSKLLNHTAEAPDFETLFAGELLGKPLRAPKIRLFPWWTVAGVAAACLALVLLLPDKLVNQSDTLSKAPIQEKMQSPIRHERKKLSSIFPKQQIQALSAPGKIKLLRVVPKNTSVAASMAESKYDSSAEPRDSTENGTLLRIRPNQPSELAVQKNRSVQEAYAQAKIRRARIRPDKTTVGFGMNSANRLLSTVNTKSDGGFALQSVAHSASDGYASLEGASASLLRTTTTSPNEWVGPDNITAAMLQNCETNYSLPINLGLTVSIPIIHDLNLITGLQYTYLVNHISGSTFDLKQELHYLGIPVKLAVNLVKRGDFVVYSAIGGTVEKGLAGVQTSVVEGEGTWKGNQSIEGIQCSLTGQFGLSYNLSNSLLLYLEPGVAWYIPSDQPVSNRTEEPFNFNLSLGLRYKLP